VGRPEFLSREEKRSSSDTNLELTAGSTREALSAAMRKCPLAANRISG
jgi:hypothetical protein